MTTQVADELMLAGTRFKAEVSAQQGKVLPNAHPGIREATRAEFNELSKDENSVFGTTACGRGYVATWLIEGRRLSLTGLRGFYRMRSKEPDLCGLVHRHA